MRNCWHRAIFALHQCRSALLDVPLSRLTVAALVDFIRQAPHRVSPSSKPAHGIRFQKPVAKPLDPPHTICMLTETITITATFGSDMQRDVSMKVLRQMLAAWESETEQHHQKNRISIVYERDDAVGTAPTARHA